MFFVPLFLVLTFLDQPQNPPIRKKGQEEWSFVSKTAKPGTEIRITNLSPTTWFQIRVKFEENPIIPTFCSRSPAGGNTQEDQTDHFLLSSRSPRSLATAPDIQVKGSLPLHHHFLRLCHREENKVLWKQPRQHDWGEPRDVCPSLFQGLSVHTLDTQPDPTGRQMLAQNRSR